MFKLLALFLGGLILSGCGFYIHTGVTKCGDKVTVTYEKNAELPK